MNEISGTDLRVWINGNIVADATNHTMSIAMKTRPTSNKDSGKFDTSAAARFNVTAQADAMKVYGHFEAVLAAMLDQSPVFVEFGHKSADPLTTKDESKFDCSGYFLITGFDDGAPDGDTATYSVKFEHSSGFAPKGGFAVVCAGIDSTGVDGRALAGIIGSPILPVAFAWDDTDNQVTQLAENLIPGTYTCTVTDADDNVSIGTVVIHAIEPA